MRRAARRAGACWRWCVFLQWFRLGPPSSPPRLPRASSVVGAVLKARRHGPRGAGRDATRHVLALVIGVAPRAVARRVDNDVVEHDVAHRRRLVAEQHARAHLRLLDVDVAQRDVRHRRHGYVALRERRRRPAERARARVARVRRDRLLRGPDPDRPLDRLDHRDVLWRARNRTNRRRARAR